MFSKPATETIYSKKQNIVHSVESYDDELRYCDRLVAMGFVKCGGVFLADRKDFLKREITRMEHKSGSGKRSHVEDMVI